MADIRAKAALPNGILIVLDPAVGVLPPAMLDRLVASTSSALVIGTVADADGETTIHLTDEGASPRDANLALVWSGAINTQGTLAVLSAYDEELITTPVSHALRVDVWVNHPNEPDVVRIEISPR